MALVDSETVELSSESRIEILYLNNPETKNSMTVPMGLEFKAHIENLKKNPPRAVVIAGKNDIFSAGGNFELLKSFAEKSFEQNKKKCSNFIIYS